MKLSLDINTDFEVTTLTDLPKLKIVMENLNMKINKSEIARHMGVDRRTVDKYLNGFEPTKREIVSLLLTSITLSSKNYFQTLANKSSTISVFFGNI